MRTRMFLGYTDDRFEFVEQVAVGQIRSRKRRLEQLVSLVHYGEKEVLLARKVIVH